MANGRTNPGDVANLMVRCLLSDVSELLGGWTDDDRERTLRYFDGRCAYTGVSYDPATFVWDHLIPHNQDACGLHVYGNLVPATRAANSAKAAKDFRVFLRQDHACLGDLNAEERETRIRRLEDFMLATGYAEKASAIKDLPALCAEQYARVKAMLPGEQGGRSCAAGRRRPAAQRGAGRASRNTEGRAAGRDLAHRVRGRLAPTVPRAVPRRGGRVHRRALRTDE